MSDSVKSIKLEKLVPHPDNPNRMSRENFAKLLANIRRAGRYEPLIVRPQPADNRRFQIINGYHRFMALSKLGYKKADAVVWDVDDQQTDMLLVTLNRLGGRDLPAKRLKILERLADGIGSRTLGRLVPAATKQLNKLRDISIPALPVEPGAAGLAEPMVLFLNSSQKQTVEKAISLAQGTEKTSAARRAASVTRLADFFIAGAQTRKKLPSEIHRTVNCTRQG